MSTHPDGLLPEYWRQGSNLCRREGGILMIVLVSMRIQSVIGSQVQAVNRMAKMFLRSGCSVATSARAEFSEPYRTLV